MAGNNQRYKMLNLERREHVAVIAIPDFTIKDTVIDTLSEELAGICSEIAFDDEIRALVITTSEKMDAFSLSAQQAKDTIFYNTAGVSSPFNAPDGIAALGFPTVAAIAGDAIGFGLELAMACDIRIASTTSRFGLTQIRGGLIPSHGGTQRLPRLIGKAMAMEMILTGDLIDAEEALRMSLITRMVPAREVDAIALDVAQNMATKGPVALRYAKESIYKGTDLTLDQGLRMEGDLYLLLCSTVDRVEGIEAFRQKRKPEFRGE
ncbi:MAG: enoyl-CoA hydratase/isomerase family protein [Smithellaceae bacterium]